MKKLLAIVGMGEGNGLAIARRFAKEGYAIAMLARNETKLNEFKNSLQREGYEAHYFTADASNEASLKSALASVKNIANLEVLVYNAAVPKMVNVLNETFESLINDFQVNVAGALVAVQSVLP
ncbi:SDR family NAD(P)-dependent oxidoreductase, partial [Planktothrix sp. FACHB-1355]